MAQRDQFIKKETGLFLPDAYHMSLMYITLPDYELKHNDVENLSRIIKNRCKKDMPMSGFLLKPKKLAYWGRLLVLIYECPEFFEYHRRVSAAIKTEFPEFQVEHDGDHQLHITLGSITTKKSNAWRQGEKEFEIYEKLPCLIEKDVPLMVMCK